MVAGTSTRFVFSWARSGARCHDLIFFFFVCVLRFLCCAGNRDDCAQAAAADDLEVRCQRGKSETAKYMKRSYRNTKPWNVARRNETLKSGGGGGEMKP